MCITAVSFPFTRGLACPVATLQSGRAEHVLDRHAGTYDSLTRVKQRILKHY